MTEFRIIRFDRISICLAYGNFISAKVIPEPLVGIKRITVVLLGFRRLVNDILNCLLAAYPDYRPAQNTSGFAIYDRQNIDSVFLSPINVNNSSISASFTSCGMGAFGKASA